MLLIGLSKTHCFIPDQQRRMRVRQQLLRALQVHLSKCQDLGFCLNRHITYEWLRKLAVIYKRFLSNQRDLQPASVVMNNMKHYQGRQCLMLA